MKRLFIVFIALIVASNFSFAKVKGAPPMATGAPDDRTCSSSKCHAGSDINSGDAVVTLQGLPESVEAGKIYDLTLTVEQKGSRYFGFQVTVVDEAGEPTGTLIVSDVENTQLIDPARYAEYSNRQYLTHTQGGAKAAKKGLSREWTFQWQAPDSVASIPSFYLAANAADGNKKKTGDEIYTRQYGIGSPK